MRRRLALRVPVVALAAMALAGCAGPPPGDASPGATGDPSNEAPRAWSGVIRHVPEDYPTIQAAVDAANPGDLILIDKGVYKEKMTVTSGGPGNSPGRR